MTSTQSVDAIIVLEKAMIDLITMALVQGELPEHRLIDIIRRVQPVTL